ncbi:MAG: hypothetical protein RIC06_21840 [Cyclobacteriaceae bacterium]
MEDSLNTLTVSSYDSLAEQEIFQVIAINGTPLYYYIEVNTGVCFDNKCRPLSILVYWNITGRYLGFELLEDEFLSKYDHEPFSTAEYERLHELLADPFLPLDEYAFEELVRDTSTMASPVDGVSGATSEDVLDYIVKGAAYTTYKLWNVIYGPIQQQVIQQTENELDASLFNRILQSTDQSDITWALERAALIEELDEPTINTISEIISKGEYFHSYLALRSLSQEQMDGEMIQRELISLISLVDQGVSKLILDRLMNANKLGSMAIDESLEQISSLNGMQLLNLLKLFEHHQVSDQRLCPLLNEAMINQNTYVKNQVISFYEKLSCK